MSKLKIVPIFGGSGEPPYHEAEIQVNAYAVMKLAETERIQADIALHFSGQLAKARAELESRRPLVEDQFRRYREAEDAATALGIGKDAPPVSPKATALMLVALFVFEFIMSTIAFDAITF